MTNLSDRSISAAEELRVVFDFFQSYRDGVVDADVAADLTFGNPHEMPLPGLVSTLKKHVEPKRVDWFAYKTSEEEPREVVAAALSEELKLPFTPDDIAMTQGAFGAIALAFTMLMDPCDECILPVPGWFCYSTILRAQNSIPVTVPLQENTFDLDIDAIERAITPRTRIVVVNTPHNPTGIIYSRERLSELASMLERKSAEIGRPIFILSDEPYRRIRFDDVEFTSPAEIYPWTLIDYSYGKILLAPGLRFGYLAICPNMPDETRNGLSQMAVSTQVAQGWGFPDAPMQYAVADLEKLSIDIDALERKRNRLHDALTQWGYNMTKPTGTFYLWGRAPRGDAVSFTQSLADRGVYVMPGTLFDRPTDFRICLTASAEMIEASLPSFEEFAE
ncbi:MAG: aminotransferase class I/II-fold pyridoxal phosphate-dependent enzyme [Rhizobiaceae bacterium]